MGKGQQQVPLVSVLTQYIAQTQQSFERTIANARKAEERKDEQLTCNVMLWEVDAAQKYKLAPSALAMIGRLKPEGPNPLKALPGTGIWMTLDDERSTTIYFSSIAHATSSYLESHPYVKKLSKVLETIVALPWLWSLEIWMLDSQPLSYVYDAERGKWSFNANHHCPAHLCEKLTVDERHWPSWYICDVCRPRFEYWTSWFPVALMAVNLDFAEVEERQEPKRVTERELRRKRTDRGYKEISITHTYHVITFDISVKTHATPIESLEHGEPSHPTWLEQAIQDETVLYVDKHIEQFPRTFKHERYVNMRGKTIDVCAHDKRIPMSVKRLKQTIYQAIAQRQV
jgi:hypothetical protein